jgi:hypothetical protein
LESYWARFAALDPGFARGARQWWESRTLIECLCERHYAWNTCEKERYQIARTYAAAKLAEIMNGEAQAARVWSRVRPDAITD